MKNIIWICLSMLMLVSCGTATSDKTNKSDTLTNVESVSDVKVTVTVTGLPVIMDFSASWCPPCQQFKPIFEEAKDRYSGQIEFKTIDVDAEKELAQQFNITSIPAIVFIDAEGNEINRIIGFTDKDSFDKAINDNFKLNNY